MTFRSRRVLPLHGEVRVALGDHVNSDDIVAEAMMPGDVDAVNLSNVLAMPPADVKDCMLKKQGEDIAIGEPIAQTSGIFGMFKKVYKSRYAGTLESVSEHTGQIIIRGEPHRVTMPAYLTGTVVEIIPNEGVVIEANVSFVQGIFGIGGETHGPIRIVTETHDQPLTPDLIREQHKGAIIVGGGRVNDAALEKALKFGVAAVVAGGMDDQDLKDFLGYDLGVAITGSEAIGTTVIITEGFGDIAMAKRTFELLKWREGTEAAVNGATQIRAGVMRPEIVMPIPPGLEIPPIDDSHEAGLLEIGRPVRVIRDPYFGMIGAVDGLPSEPAILGSGSKSRVLSVRFETGEAVIVPRANVELIEG
jgi:hypothetical protein